jgi:hypothetical protein
VCALVSAADGVLPCATCHDKQGHDQPQTSMAHALELPAGNLVLQEHPRLTFRRGLYTWTVERHGDSYTYSVTDGTNTISLPIVWALGAKSQTWVLEYDGRLYESLVSYFPGIDGLDLTMGDDRLQPATLVEAMGRVLSVAEARPCFQCHATAAVSNDEVLLRSFVPGVQCEHCHIGAIQHAADISHGKLNSVPPKLKQLSAEGVSSFCGQCHRSFADVARGRMFGQVDVRFQPYRLSLSKCFDGNDRRISCLTCHDPHREVNRDDASYDPQCLACHSQGAKAPLCTVGKSGCVSCHMAKRQLPGGHQVFTDHFIRVVRPGEPYPDAPSDR